MQQFLTMEPNTYEKDSTDKEVTTSEEKDSTDKEDR